MRGTMIQRDALLKSFIRLTFKDGEGEEKGSGILIWHDGLCYLLTAGHCIPSGKLSGIKAEHKINSKFTQLKLGAIIHHECVDIESADGKDFAIIQLTELPELGKTILLPSAIENYTQEDKNFTYGFPSANKHLGHHMDIKAAMESQWIMDAGFENSDSEITEICKGFSGSGIIDFSTAGEAVCVGVLRGFTTKIGATRYLLATPITLFESYLKDWVEVPIVSPKYNEGNDDTSVLKMVPNDTNQTDNYIPRYCTHLSDMEIWWRSDDSERHNLYDYIYGKVSGVESNKILLLGDPHSGKTYELNHLVSELRNAGEDVVHIQIKDNISVDWTKISINPNSILIIDGLDEARVDNLEKTIQQVTGYAKTHPMQRMVVSCRENFMTPFSKEDVFLPVRFQKLTDKDIKDYINANCDASEEVIKEITNKGIEELCTSPFNLINIIAKGKQNQSTGFHLPESRVSIFEFSIDSQFHENKKSFDIDQISHDDVKRLMKNMAFTMVLKDVYELSEEELEKVAEGGDFKRLLMSNSVVKITADGKYSFVSNGIREFLAAQKLLDYDDKEVIKKASITGTHKIRRKLQETIKWWVEKRAEQGKLKEEIINWIWKENNPSLLLGCTPTSLSDDYRHEIVLQILDQSRNEGIVFSPFYYNKYAMLFRFANSPKFLEFLLNELRGNIESGVNRYNILSLCSYIPWDSLKRANPVLYQNLIDQLLVTLRAYANEEDSSILFYWLMSTNHFIRQEGFLSKLVDIVKGCHNPYTMSAMCSLIYKSRQSDQFVDYILEADKYVKDQGHTIISRQSVYAAMGAVKESENIKKMLDLMLQKVEEHRYLREEEEYLNMIQSLLTSLVNTEDGLKLYGEIVTDIIPATYEHDPDKRKLYGVFETINSQQKISDDTIVSKVRNAITYPQKSPEEIEKRRVCHQKQFDDLWKIDSFRDQVETLITAANDNPGVDWNILLLNLGWGNNYYIIDLVIREGGWDEINWDKVKNFVQDREKYELFRFEKTLQELRNSYSDVVVSEEIIAEIKKTAGYILSNIGKENITYHLVKLAMSLLIQGGIEVAEDVLWKLLPYSFEEFETGSKGIKKSVFEYISETIPAQQFLIQLRKIVNSGRHVNTPYYKNILNYLFDYGNDADRGLLYSKLLEYPGSNTVFYLLDRFLQEENYQEKLLNDFNAFSPYDQLTIFNSLVKYPSFRNSILQKLEQEYGKYDSNYRIEALRKLVYNGSLMALNVVANEISQKEINGPMYNFSYADPKALSTLIQLLKKIENWDNIYESTRQSIYVSIGTIASNSEEALSMVMSELSNILGDTPLAKRLERYCHERRLDVIDNMMTQD